jgi:ATP phosphoribosyltransferase|tara:strand:+ start:125 stop:322 length:198 start_codon:yes stop_codon:yes gene_type:complete
MSIRNEIKELFVRASQNNDNIFDGKIDWGFVEADVMIELGVDRIIEEMGSLEAFYPLFDSLVEAA